jgi:pimeloyl-ACP methyl ester carboxylesterase
MSLDVARDCTSLLLPGAYAERLRGAMRPNLERLSRLGLQARHARLDDGASIARNVEGLREDLQSLARAGRKAILFGHSSGAVAITATLALHPDTHALVHRVVLMQTTYRGSPIADLFAHPTVFPFTALAVDRWMRGDVQAIVDVTTAVRRAFVEQHPYPGDAVPTVALVTRRLSLRSPLFPLQLHLRLRHGVASDGLVPTEHQRIPGAHTVEMELDHAQPVIGRAAGDITERLLRIALALPDANFRHFRDPRAQDR